MGHGCQSILAAVFQVRDFHETEIELLVEGMVIRRLCGAWEIHSKMACSHGSRQEISGSCCAGLSVGRFVHTVWHLIQERAGGSCSYKMTSTSKSPTMPITATFYAFQGSLQVQPVLKRGSIRPYLPPGGEQKHCGHAFRPPQPTLSLPGWWIGSNAALIVICNQLSQPAHHSQALFPQWLLHSDCWPWPNMSNVYIRITREKVAFKSTCLWVLPPEILTQVVWHGPRPSITEPHKLKNDWTIEQLAIGYHLSPYSVAYFGELPRYFCGRCHHFIHF